MDRSILISGGNRGIGLAVARSFAEAGDRVAVTYRTGEPPAGLLGVRCDVTDPDAVEAAFKEVEQTHGPVEVLVANAGITRDMLLFNMTDRDFQEVLDVNLVGAFRLARRALAGMIEARWGRLLFVSSATALMGAAGQANYAASKAGMIGFARSIAWELGRCGITANVVAPGPIESDMTDQVTEKRYADAMRMSPLGHVGELSDVAGVVRFLASDEARYVTGAVIPVSGGFGLGH